MSELVLHEKSEKPFNVSSLPVLLDGDESFEDYHLKNHDFIFNCTDLTAIQMDMMAMMLTYMTKESWDNGQCPTFHFDTEKLTKWFGCSAKQLHSKLKAPSKALAKKQFIFIDDDNEEFSFASLLKAIEYKKGVLTMTPNDVLRDIYLITATSDEKNKGFGKIYNDVYRALSVPNTKRVFEMISRFRERGMEMHPQDVRNLQCCLGIMTREGRVLKSTYASEKTFVSRIISVAMEQIAALPEAKKRLNLKRSELTGTLGYELLPKAGDQKGFKLRFLAEWKEGVDEKRHLEADLQSALDDAKEAKEKGERTLPHLEKVADLLSQLGETESLGNIKNKIVEIKRREAHEKQLREAEMRNNERELVKRSLQSFPLDEF